MAATATRTRKAAHVDAPVATPEPVTAEVVQAQAAKEMSERGSKIKAQFDAKMDAVFGGNRKYRITRKFDGLNKENKVPTPFGHMVTKGYALIQTSGPKVTEDLIGLTKIEGKTAFVVGESVYADAVDLGAITNAADFAKVTRTYRKGGAAAQERAAKVKANQERVDALFALWETEAAS